MKVVVINSDYQLFLRDFYAAQPGLERETFAQQMAERMRTRFGVADFYSHALRALGHEAIDVHFNNHAAQEAWVRERGLDPGQDRRSLGVRLRGGIVPWPTLRVASTRLESILERQIEEFRPDMVLDQTMGSLSAPCLRRVGRHTRVLVGQHAVEPLPASRRWRQYDLVVSSSPKTVAWFRTQGVEARLHRLGFDPRVLEGTPPSARIRRVTFVGSLHPIHTQRREWLERVCTQLDDVEVFSAEATSLHQASAIRRCSRTPVWGADMYRILLESAITLNHHTDDSPHANNLRLYEATGCGALLLTDSKPDLGTLFDVGREVAAYSDADDCVAKVRHYLGTEGERTAIAVAGQRRTLGSHTYAQRMRELVAMVESLQAWRRETPR